jgi:hypothetical protein
MTNGANQYVILSQNLTGGAQAHTFSRLYFRIANASATATMATGTDSTGNNLWAVIYDAGSHGLDVYFWNGSRTRFDFYTNTNLLTANTWYSLEIELNEATTGRCEWQSLRYQQPESALPVERRLQHDRLLR